MEKKLNFVFNEIKNTYAETCKKYDEERKHPETMVYRRTIENFTKIDMTKLVGIQKYNIMQKRIREQETLHKVKTYLSLREEKYVLEMALIALDDIITNYDKLYFLENDLEAIFINRTVLEISEELINYSPAKIV